MKMISTSMKKALREHTMKVTKRDLVVQLYPSTPIKPLVNRVQAAVKMFGISSLMLGAGGAGAQLVSQPSEDPISQPLEGTGKIAAGTPLQVDKPSNVYQPIPIQSANALNSSVQVSPDEGIWHESKGLPLGSRILMRVMANKAPADGKTTLKVHVEIFDKDGKPIKTPTKLVIETSHGGLLGVTPDTMGLPENYRGDIHAGEVTTKDGAADFTLRAPLVAGDALLKASSGAIVSQGQISFVPDLRDLIVIGLIDGVLSFNRAKGPAAGSVQQFGFTDSMSSWSKTTTNSDGTDSRTRSAEGRVAMFAKGAIGNGYLLTLAIDTDRYQQQRNFRDLDPYANYPVFGDTSARMLEGRSTTPVYARIDKDKSYLLYGDYTTAVGDQGTQLSSMTRTLTGFKGNYEDNNFRVGGFAARVATTSVVNEIPGIGLSGPYAIAQPNALVNSETIALITRDRTQPSIILSRKVLTRYVDYNFEIFTGRVIFTQAVPSVDSAGNPVSIQIAYEVDNGTGSKHMVVGVNGRVNLTKNISVGANYAKDYDSFNPYQIAGANLQANLGPKTSFLAEVAQSKGTNAYNQGINGALSTANTLTDQKGNAYRAEVRHNDDSLSFRVAAARADVGFQNANSTVLPGNQALVADATYKVTPNVSVRASLNNTKDFSGTTTDGAHRTSGSVGLGVKVTEWFNVDVGINSVKEHLVNGSAGSLTSLNQTATANTIPGWGFNGTGLLNSPLTAFGANNVPTTIDNQYTSGRIRLTEKVGENFSVWEEYERALNNGSNSAGGSRQRIALGGEYRVTDKTRIYAGYEFQNTLTGIYSASNDGSRNTSAVAGISTTLNVPYLPEGQIYSEYRALGGFGNTDAAAAAGIRNTWKITPDFAVAGALERQQQLQSSTGNNANATAISLSAQYAGDKYNRYAGKIEYRISDVQNQALLSGAYTRILSNNWSAIVRENYLYAAGKGSNDAMGNQTQNQFQVGLAYRDVERGRWNALFRVENRINKSTNASFPTNDRSWIGSLQAVYHPSRDWTFSGQYAAKLGHSIDPSSGTDSSYNGKLISGRAIVDIADGFDATVYGSYGRDSNQSLAGVGVELGARVMTNLWLSGGYTYGRFADVDQFSSRTSWQGWHIRLSCKFNQDKFCFGDAPKAEPLVIVAPPPPPPPAPPKPVAPAYEKITLNAGAMFSFDKSDVEHMLPAGRAQLDELATKLKNLQKIERITITGYTDVMNSTRNPDYNEGLSLARAQTVKDYLAAKGVDVSRTDVKGLGASNPVQTNCAIPKGAIMIGKNMNTAVAKRSEVKAYEDCLQPNRRVELEIFGEKVVK